MIAPDFIHHLSAILGSNVQNIQGLRGGDICEAYLLETAQQQFFLKTNSAANALAMLQAEHYALERIAATKTIASPAVLASGAFQQTAYLILEYIPSKSPSAKDFERFGNELAALHKSTATSFGWTDNNFIGTLAQHNASHKSWTHFYVTQRLVPQLQLAVQLGMLNPAQVPTETRMIEKCNSYFEHCTPSLVHGDLWSGNYLIAENGTPYLIDPAAYYGHAGVDIAMSKLFGGFGPHFYEAYHAHIPRTEQSDIQEELYQLYYLLVHLNLFGLSYQGQVLHILNRYF